MTCFRVEFALAIQVQQLAREFQDLRLTTKTVAGITTKFRKRALLVLQYSADEEMKKTRNIGEPKWHHHELVMTIMSPEFGLLHIIRSDCHQMIP